MIIKNAKRSILGFTLIELMIAVVIAAILVTIALPNFRDFMRRNNVSAQANNLLADIQYARSEAITRRTFVSLCPRPAGATDDSTSCVPGGGTNFDNGWIVYQTTALNTVFTGGVGQQLLRITAAPRMVSIRSPVATILTLNARGELASEITGRNFFICYKAGPDQTAAGQSSNAVPGSRLNIATSGRASIQPLQANAVCD